MPRGRPSPLGTETVNANGYTQVKTDKGWVGKHIVILEKTLGRELATGERAAFKDGDITNFDPDNIVLIVTRDRRSIAAKIAKLQAEVDDRLALIEALKLELALEQKDQ